VVTAAVQSQPYQPDEAGDVSEAGEGRREERHRHDGPAMVPHEPRDARE